MVHNVLYTDSLVGTKGIINAWRTNKSEIPTGFRFTTSPVVDMLKVMSINKGQNNIAMIAHNQKKLDLCLLGVQFMDKILQYDFILATGTTGSWLKKFLLAAISQNPKFGHISKLDLDAKFILCETGPKGGDVQIAHVALSGFCNRVIFMIDPMEAHPHEPVKFSFSSGFFHFF
jgi:methylglyoxal synthase